MQFYPHCTELNKICSRLATENYEKVSSDFENNMKNIPDRHYLSTHYLVNIFPGHLFLEYT